MSAVYEAEDLFYENQTLIYCWLSEYNNDNFISTKGKPLFIKNWTHINKVYKISLM